MDTPFISFIIPMYNAEKYIAACIESIQSQDLNMLGYEIVIVDDGSSDNGKNIVLNCCNDSNIRYYWQENKGQSSARNKGLEFAKGEYVYFVDADDVLIPHSLRPVLDQAKHYDLDMVSFNLVRKKYGEPLIADSNLNSRNVSISNVMTGAEYIEKYDFNNGPCWYIVRKETLIQEKIKFVPGHYGEDGMFTMELLMHIKRIVHVDSNCYLYILRPNSTTSSRDIAHQKKMLDDYIFVYYYMQNTIKKNTNFLSEKAIERCNARSETYIYFLMIRLLRFPDSNVVKSYVKKLKEKRLYPVKKPYDSFAFSVMTIVINHYWLLILSNRILKMIPLYVLRKLRVA